MIYRRLFEKYKDIECIKRDAFCDVVKNLDIDKTYNIEMHTRELDQYEIDLICNNQFKRTDGQFIWNGALISYCLLCDRIKDKYFVVEILIEQVENIHKPIVIAKWEYKQ